jgi:hypothetical protein
MDVGYFYRRTLLANRGTLSGIRHAGLGLNLSSATAWGATDSWTAKLLSFVNSCNPRDTPIPSHLAHFLDFGQLRCTNKNPPERRTRHDVTTPAAAALACSPYQTSPRSLPLSYRYQTGFPKHYHYYHHVEDPDPN